MNWSIRNRTLADNTIHSCLAIEKLDEGRNSVDGSQGSSSCDLNMAVVIQVQMVAFIFRSWVQREILSSINDYSEVRQRLPLLAIIIVEGREIMLVESSRRS